MAILVRVLVLVACGPLLVPPGFCVCKAGVSSCTTSGMQSVAGQDAAPTPSRKTARCSHRHGPAKLVSDTTPPGSRTPLPTPAPHDDHAPDCPSAGVERPQWIEPTAGTDVVPMPAAFVGVALVPVTGECRPPDRPVLNRSCSPPLYLSQCSLVI